MVKQRGLTKEGFEELLLWLDPDRDRAGRRYEEIRRSLIRIFTWRGYGDAEDLADETFNRAAEKAHTVKEGYMGDPVAYFYGIANRLIKERQREAASREQLEEAKLQSAPPDEGREEEGVKAERISECLRRCLQELSPKQRDIFLRYHLGETPDQISRRKELAARLGIAHGALRVRVHRIRALLEDCIERCLEEATWGETD